MHFDAQVRETLLYKKGFLTNLSLWENVSNYLHAIK